MENNSNSGDKIPHIEAPITRRPAGSRPAGSRPAGSRPAGSRPAGSRPAGSRPAGSRPAGSRPAGSRPAGSRPAGSRPTGSRPAGSRPNGTRKPNSKKKNVRGRENYRRKLMIMGFVICAITLLVAIVMNVFLVRLNVVTLKYIVLGDIVLAIILAWMTYLQKWITPGIIGKIVAILMSVTMVILSIYMNITYDKVTDMTGVNVQEDCMYVLVLKDDPANDIVAAKDYVFGNLIGIAANADELSKKTIADINDEIKKSDQAYQGIDIESEFNTPSLAAEALYNGTVKAIIMNGSMVNSISNIEGFEKFDDDTKVIYEKVYESEIAENKDNDNYLSGGDKVFTIYVSGIDTRGNSPKVNSNSDVNILMTVNLETRQVLLISTPRDYYVPLSISNGVKDKLTHAGGYGVNVSVETLEMLYEVNVKDYLKINFTGFIDVIDELGGITVNSDASFTTDDGVAVREGDNEFNGEQALSFARERHHVSGGDKGRGNHQMAVIEAVIHKMASSQLLKNYTNILDSLSESMVTSMSYGDISDLVKFQLNDMKAWDVQKYSVDGFDASEVTYSAGSQRLYVMVPDEETINQAKEYLKQMYNGQKIRVIEKDKN